MSLLSERHLMTVVINMHKPYFIFKTCHGYEGAMSVLCTPLQVKCYPVGYETEKQGEKQWKISSRTKCSFKWNKLETIL